MPSSEHDTATGATPDRSGHSRHLPGEPARVVHAASARGPFQRDPSARDVLCHRLAGGEPLTCAAAHQGRPCHRDLHRCRHRAPGGGLHGARETAFRLADACRSDRGAHGSGHGMAAAMVACRAHYTTDEPLEFKITMDTHSGDLSMHLAAFSTPETGQKLFLPALDRTGGSGHHVEGVLTFPASTPDGRPLLKGAAFLVLTIRDVDTSARAFEWNLATLP